MASDLYAVWSALYQLEEGTGCACATGYAGYALQGLSSVHGNQWPAVTAVSGSPCLQENAGQYRQCTVDVAAVQCCRGNSFAAKGFVR